MFSRFPFSRSLNFRRRWLWRNLRSTSADSNQCRDRSNQAQQITHWVEPIRWIMRAMRSFGLNLIQVLKRREFSFSIKGGGVRLIGSTALPELYSACRSDEHLNQGVEILCITIAHLRQSFAPGHLPNLLRRKKPNREN